jgi:hypothetical protein
MKEAAVFVEANMPGFRAQILLSAYFMGGWGHRE